MAPFDFPTNPPIGTSATTPDGAVRYWDGVKWDAAYAGPALPADPGNQLVIAQNATIARTLANRFADRYSVEDWLTPGQPDGTTDNMAQLQAALDTAAGVVGTPTAITRAAAPGNAALLIPANTNTYVIGNPGLTVPSNSHLIIEAGATLQAKGGQQSNMLALFPNTTNVLIELYGTLDGNNRGGAVFPSGGICAPGGGPVSNIYVRGDRRGLIKDMNVFPCNLTHSTNSEISGITVDGSGTSFGYAGTTANIAASTVVSGTYSGATLTLQTAAAHGLVPGNIFTVTGITFLAPQLGIWPRFSAGAGTTGTTIVATAPAGYTATPITSGAVHSLVGAPYPSIPGGVQITTIQPHGLVPGSVFNLYNTYATGNVLSTQAPATQYVGEFTALAGTTGNTIVYSTTGGIGPFVAGVLGVTSPSVNAGIVDCTVRNVADLGVVFYGGVHRGYIRNCDVSQCTSAVVAVFSDTAQRGVNYDCDISGNKIYNNNSVGIYVGGNIYGNQHQDTLIQGNDVFGNPGGACNLNGADGVLVTGNYFHENIYTAPNPAAAFQMSGEIVVGPLATRVRISDNVIFNPMLGCTDGKGYGVAINAAPYLIISGNRIGDYQLTKTMTAALGGSWDSNGLSEGNYYGPRIATTGLFPADLSLYASGSQQGISYDAVIGAVCGSTPIERVQALIGGMSPARSIAGGVPGQGLTVGWNNTNAAGTNRPGLGDVDFFVGDGGQVGGFNFFQAQAAKVTGTYSSVTGAVVLTSNMPHTLIPGEGFQLRAVGGTAVGTGTDWVLLNGVWTATAGTNGALVSSTGNTYDNGTGIVTLATMAAHGIAAGAAFVVSAAAGTTAAVIPPIFNLNGTWTATSVTGTTITFTALPALGILTITGGQVSGTTLTFTAPLNLDITSITTGLLSVAGGSGVWGAVNTNVGVGGSLLANDGYGNTRLGGALVHGALQAPSLANGGTYTILPNTSFVAIRNSASIATGTVVLPDPGTGFAYPVPALGGHNELEINFQNPVGALTITAGGTLTVSGAPTAIAAAGTSINFIQLGTVWQRRIMQ